MTIVDHIEVTGHVFTGPAPGNYHNAIFDRPREPISFSILQPVEVAYYHSEGINNIQISMLAAQIVGPGFYGIRNCRVID